MNINFSTLIQKIFPLLGIIFITYIISNILFFYLPKKGVNFIQNNSYNLSYYNYSGYYSNFKVKKEPKNKQVKNIESLSSYILKAIYSTFDNEGWVVIEEKTGNKKNYILTQNDKIKGYTLKKLFKTYIIFEKNNKEFKLTLNNSTNSNLNLKTVTNTNVQNIIVNDNGLVQVNRDYLNSYVNNIDKIWNNIAINEVREGNKITGFRVDNINKDSAFATIGLKKGDIIKTINNNALNSYAAAFKAYNNINETQYLNIEILRNNQIMELNYEIN